jgi:CubicO group peptidase (beta-lactamase class C family)
LKKLIVLLLLTIILLSGCSAPATSAVTPELQQKLDLLVEQLEQQRQTLHVPGMAIAVVKDDEVILTHGFGVTNVEPETPVTPETIFAIGSST